MVTDGDGFFAQVFRTVNTKPRTFESRSLPMLNTVHTSLNNFLAAYGQTRKKKRLMEWYKAIPELTAIVNKVAKDITYKFHFEPVKPDETGRNKILTANKFSTKVGLRRIMESQIVDQLITGEGFGWIGKLTQAQIEGELNKLLKKERFLTRKEKKEVKDRVLSEQKFTEGFTETDHIDEDSYLPRLYRSVASSTMEVIHDEYDIAGYRQVVGALKEHVFKKNEIIRYTHMDVDGRVEGFTPVESIIVQLELLRQMWQNNLALHHNGGHPDKVFILKNEKAGSASFNKIEESLKKYRVVENKHGHMLFAGDVDIKELEQLDDMFFQNLGLYVTGVIGMQWQVPKSSLSFIVGGTNTKDDTGGNSEKGYWRNIETMQDKFCEIMNTQLWMPFFGVKIVFDNTFLHQDVQFQTATQLKLNNVKLMDEILAGGELQLNESKRLRLLGLNMQEVEELKEQIDMSAPGMNNQMPLATTSKSDSQLEKNKRKSDLNNQSSNAQGNKPTGVGKEKAKNRSFIVQTLDKGKVKIDEQFS